MYNSSFIEPGWLQNGLSASSKIEQGTGSGQWEQRRTCWRHLPGRSGGWCCTRPCSAAARGYPAAQTLPPSAPGLSRPARNPQKPLVGSPWMTWIATDQSGCGSQRVGLQAGGCKRMGVCTRSTVHVPGCTTSQSSISATLRPAIWRRVQHGGGRQ